MKTVLLLLFMVSVLFTKELSTEYPLHFVGSIPRADCQMKYQLDLFDNRTYFLREECFKDGVSTKTNDDIGRWYSDNENRVVLNGTKIKAKYFFIVNETTLEQMDLKGKRVISKPIHQLKHTGNIQSIEPKLLIQGVYSYMADAAILYECATGLSFPVAFEKDNRALEKAYINAGASAGQTLKVYLDVQISDRKMQDCSVKQSTIIVEKFLKMIPKEKCQNPYSKAKLKETYWKLTQINSKPLPLSKSSRREAHMILSSDFKIKGSSGCNSFHGTYEQEKETLKLIKPMMMSRMFCKGELEQEYMKVLEEMRSYKIQSEYLEIFDKDGANLARFESVYLY